VSVVPSYILIREESKVVAIKCRRCGDTSRDAQDIKLLSCPTCGSHSVMPAGMGGLLDSERSKPDKEK